MYVCVFFCVSKGGLWWPVGLPCRQWLRAGWHHELRGSQRLWSPRPTRRLHPGVQASALHQQLHPPRRGSLRWGLNRGCPVSFPRQPVFLFIASLLFWTVSPCCPSCWLTCTLVCSTQFLCIKASKHQFYCEVNLWLKLTCVCVWGGGIQHRLHTAFHVHVFEADINTEYTPNQHTNSSPELCSSPEGSTSSVCKMFHYHLLSLTLRVYYKVYSKINTGNGVLSPNHPNTFPE